LPSAPRSSSPAATPQHRLLTPADSPTPQRTPPQPRHASIAALSRSAHGLWIAALAVLGLAFGLAIQTSRRKGAEDTGPPVARLNEERKTRGARQIRESLREDLTEAAEANEHALARKSLLFDRALIVMALAVLIDLAGRL
jgi:hypothetical protein